MKLLNTFFILGLFLGSFNGAAASELLLDASCKATCLISVEEVGANQGGYIYNRVYRTVYFDFKGLSRKKIEDRSNAESVKLLCKEEFGASLSATAGECLYFKH